MASNEDELPKRNTPSLWIRLLAVSGFLVFFWPFDGTRTITSSRPKAEMDIEFLSAVVGFYREATGHYPTTLDELVTHRESDSWDGPFWNGPIPLDPWNRPYVYVAGRLSA